MNKKEVLSFQANSVNTVVAFEVWGIDVADLENRMRKIKELNLWKF